MRVLYLPRRRGNGYRDYPVEAVEWVCYLRSAQALGFTLAEIEAGMPLLAGPANAGGIAGGIGAQGGRSGGGVSVAGSGGGAVRWR